MPVEAPSSSPPPPKELIVPQAPSVKRSGMAEAAATSGRQCFQRFVHMTARSYRPGDLSRRGENTGRIGKTGSENAERRSFVGPASLLRCRTIRPFGRLVGAAGPFGPLATVLAQRFPTSLRRDLTTALIYRRVATTRLPLWPSWNLSAVGSVARNTLSVSPHGTAATPPDRRISRLLFPPPSATHGMDDLGLALPLRARRPFPGTFGFLHRPLPQPANPQDQD